jgi:hypothetical protein
MSYLEKGGDPRARLTYPTQDLVKPLRGAIRLTLLKGGQRPMRLSERMRDWSFSASADWVVALLLAVAIVAAFV